MCERAKSGITLKFVPEATRRMELPSTKMGETE